LLQCGTDPAALKNGPVTWFAAKMFRSQRAKRPQSRCTAHQPVEQISHLQNAELRTLNVC
jgi:hypothetical protein